MKKKSKTTKEINGIRYEWVGGFGCVMASHEKDMWEGDCRKILGDWFYVYMKHDAFKKNRCCWISIIQQWRHDREWIDGFKKKFEEAE